MEIFHFANLFRSLNSPYFSPRSKFGMHLKCFDVNSFQSFTILKFSMKLHISYFPFFPPISVFLGKEGKNLEIDSNYVEKRPERRLLNKSEQSQSKSRPLFFLIFQEELISYWLLFFFSFFNLYFFFERLNL